MERVRWYKSSYSSDDGNCVEIQLAGTVGVRDSKDLAGAVLTFPQAAWSAFTSAIRTGEFG